MNDKLFEQLERLNNPQLSGDALQEEINRADSVTDIAKTIISNADLALKAAIARDEKISWKGRNDLPEMLGSGEGNDLTDEKPV